MVDFEGALQLLSRLQSDSQLSQSFAALRKAFSSPEGAALLQSLSADPAQPLQRLTRAASAGDKAAARGILAEILATPEGRAFSQSLGKNGAARE